MSMSSTAQCLESKRHHQTLRLNGDEDHCAAYCRRKSTCCRALQLSLMHVLTSNSARPVSGMQSESKRLDGGSEEYEHCQHHILCYASNFLTSLGYTPCSRDGTPMSIDHIAACEAVVAMSFLSVTSPITRDF